MSAGTKIEWTEATWNPLTGCTKVSPGCDHCYAETLHERFHGKGSFATVTLHEDRLTQPLRWYKPRRVFVNSMSDLFHADVPDEFIAKVFAIMAATGEHTFQLLTKRHARMRAWIGGPGEAQVREHLRAWSRKGIWLTQSSAWLAAKGMHESVGWPLPNLWLGVSVETQQWADIRIPALLDTPAAVRWISAEPLLGPVALHRYLPNGFGEGIRWNPQPSRLAGAAPVLDWVVCGGESGHGARPMHPDWARSLRDQCGAAGVPFHFKQAGTILARQWGGHGKGGDPTGWPEAFPREYPRGAE